MEKRREEIERRGEREGLRRAPREVARSAELSARKLWTVEGLMALREEVMRMESAEKIKKGMGGDEGGDMSKGGREVMENENGKIESASVIEERVRASERVIEVGRSEGSEHKRGRERRDGAGSETMMTKAAKKEGAGRGVRAFAFAFRHLYHSISSALIKHIDEFEYGDAIHFKRDYVHTEFITVNGEEVPVPVVYGAFPTMGGWHVICIFRVKEMPERKDLRRYVDALPLSKIVKSEINTVTAAFVADKFRRRFYTAKYDHWDHRFYYVFSSKLKAIPIVHRIAKGLLRLYERRAERLREKNERERFVEVLESIADAVRTQFKEFESMSADPSSQWRSKEEWKKREEEEKKMKEPEFIKRNYWRLMKFISAVKRNAPTLGETLESVIKSAIGQPSP